MPSKNLEYYRALPYTRRCKPAPEPGEDGRTYWIAEVQELSGCKTDGANAVEAMHNLDDAFDQYIAAKLVWGSVIPEPRSGAGRPATAPPVLEVRFPDDSDQTTGSVPAAYHAESQQSVSRNLVAARNC